MSEGREGVSGDMNIETIDTLGEGVDAGTLMDHNVRPRQHEVSAGPVLQERCE
jgi:hypothetical protein